MTAQERECIQIFREADDTVKTFIFDMLLCFAYCDEDFISEIMEAKGDKNAMIATVTKYVGQAKEREAA